MTNGLAGGEFALRRNRSLMSEMGRVSRASCEYSRRATIREMKEGPSGSAIRC